MKLKNRSDSREFLFFDHNAQCDLLLNFLFKSSHTQEYLNFSCYKIMKCSYNDFNVILKERKLRSVMLIYLENFKDHKT